MELQTEAEASIPLFLNNRILFRIRNHRLEEDNLRVVGLLKIF